MSANGDVHEDSDANHHAKDAGTAVGDEREGDADDGGPTDDHGGVDDDLPKEDGGDANGEEHTETVASGGGDVESPEQECEVEEHEDGDASETVFFGPIGEREVVFGFGDEAFLNLSALSVASASETAGTDGDDRVFDLPVASVGVVFDLQESEDARALVVVHDEPCGGGGGDEDGSDECNGFAFDAFEEDHDSGDECDEEGGAEVGFEEDEQHGDGDGSKDGQEAF